MATSAISRIVMNDFDAKFRDEMRRLKIEMLLHMRYIDDIRVVMRILKAGIVVRNGKLEVDKEVEKRGQYKTWGKDNSKISEGEDE